MSITTPRVGALVRLTSTHTNGARIFIEDRVAPLLADDTCPLRMETAGPLFPPDPVDGWVTELLELEPPPEPRANRYMMATRATHATGDISRDDPDLAIIYGEADDHYIGEWVTGVGFINVRFPKETTRELTDAERDHYDGRVIELCGMVRPIVIAEASE